jgi:hypothetical protein
VGISARQKSSALKVVALSHREDIEGTAKICEGNYGFNCATMLWEFSISACEKAVLVEV